MVIFVKPAKRSLNIWHGRGEDQWEVRSKDVGVGGCERACVWGGGACVPVRMGAWVCVGMVQVVMKRILHCDIFNTTKFHSSSTTHGNNLNSKQHQCMHLCVCVHACVMVSSHKWLFFIFLSPTLLPSHLPLSPKQRARTHTHKHTHKTIVFVFIRPSIFFAPPCVRLLRSIFHAVESVSILSSLFLSLFLYTPSLPPLPPSLPRLKKPSLHTSLLLSSPSFCTSINLYTPHPHSLYLIALLMFCAPSNFFSQPWLPLSQFLSSPSLYSSSLSSPASSSGSVCVTVRKYQLPFSFP